MNEQRIITALGSSFFAILGSKGARGAQAFSDSNRRAQAFPHGS
jgi:hypothetical protein